MWLIYSIIAEWLVVVELKAVDSGWGNDAISAGIRRRSVSGTVRALSRHWGGALGEVIIAVKPVCGRVVLKPKSAPNGKAARLETIQSKATLVPVSFEVRWNTVASLADQKSSSRSRGRGRVDG